MSVIQRMFVLIFVLLSTVPKSRAADVENPSNKSQDEQSTQAAFHLLSGYSGYPGISDGGSLIGWALEAKNVSFSDLTQRGDWEAGGSESFVFGKNRLSNITVYVGHGIADNNRFSAGMVAGIGMLSKLPYTGFFSENYINPLIGGRASYEIPIYGSLCLTPMVLGEVSSLPGTHFIYSANLGISYVFPFKFQHR